MGFVRHNNGMTDRLLYVRARDGIRTHILHVVTVESWPTRNQRTLRDYLRSHPAEAARSAQPPQWMGLPYASVVDTITAAAIGFPFSQRGSRCPDDGPWPQRSLCWWPSRV
ncbi:GrpB family protein [Lentzea sp. PSKA42]|uniref:GrpB family protein n=1 Tax=Lentzea indica TaxID=2604800 RepID=A0ABX1FF18_9PSEU|nr:GrpB family protein [Lentzea indica]